MARKAAPTKNTSGSGFTFEDRVIAYFLACLVAGDVPFDSEWGYITRLDFQTRVQDWYLDDILIIFSGGTRLALSLKSSEQISGKSLPDDFVSDVWEQYLQSGSRAFNIASDYLGLVTSPLPSKTNEALQEMGRWARDQDEERFLIQIKAAGVSSAVKRDLFSSLACPTELAVRHGVSDKDSIRLLRRLRFLSFDFQNEPSRDLAESKRRCRNMLRSGDPGGAEGLWDRLIGIASQYRQSGGYLDLPVVLNLLQGRFALKPWPQYAPDIEAIARWTEASLANLPDKIGLKVRLPRAEEVSKIGEFFASTCFLALTGASGCGKSVIVKNWIGTLTDVPVLWIDGKTLDQGSRHVDLQRELGLSHPLEEVASSVPSKEAYCVIDGAGSIFSDEGYRNLAGLIRALHAGDEGSPWRLLLVCQQEEWNRVYLAASRAFGSVLPWAKLSVEGLAGEGSAAELREVWREFPQLQRLILQPDLRSLLLRPKILDLIATRLALGVDVSTAGWVGESSIALWYWKTEIEKAPAEVTRSRIVRQLAEQQADALSPQISAGEALGVIDALVNERVLRYSQERISFDHDLLGDWARLQVLIEKQGSLADFIRSKIVSPFWNRAVRLYGLYLLEHGSPELWKEALDALGVSAAGGSLSQDLILESVVFAANPLRLLEDLWPYLREDGGKLFRRLLGRFLYAATEPNPRMLALATTPVAELRQSTEDRLPYWPYWLPMLSFLHIHEEEAIKLAPHQVSGVANTWLRHTPTGWPGRQEAAGLALAAAEDALSHEWVYGYSVDATAELAFSAALAAGNEKPEELRGFVLRAAGRAARPDRMGRSSDPDRQPARRQTVPPGMARRRENPEPWPDGPIQEPNDEFQKICFKTPAIFSLIDSAPALAGEVLLALLISTPREYDFDGDAMGGLRDMECELSDGLSYHYPPFYWNYPWLYFIRTKPQQAIDTIIKLVNFATERWGEVLYRRHKFSPSVSFRTGDAEHVWSGDGQAYFWYTGNHGPHAVSSVLMTLEFWLYEQLNNGTPVDPYIEQIVSRSRSVAFAGVLASVACKNRALLHGPLRFLMSVPEFLYLERQKLYSISAQTAMIAWSGRGRVDNQYAHDWHSMPHRKEGLESVAHGLMLTAPDIRAYFNEVRKDWRKRRNAMRRQDPEGAADLERLISVFTPEHHTFEYSEDHKGVLITHNLPNELEERARPIRESAELGLLRTTFPMQCRRLLDGETVMTSDEERNAFWDRCQQIMAMPADEDRLTRNEDCACGAAAVFLLKWQDWLSRHPERDAWSREQIVNTIGSPPENFGFDTEVDASEWHWHSFCAAAIPYLWARDVGSTELRECVAYMALDHHYRTVGSLFRACHAERRRLGDQFVKLQALLRHWALERISLRRREDMLNGGYVLRSEQRRSFRAIMDLGEDLPAKLLSESFLKTITAFVDDTLPAVLPPLGDDAVPEPAHRFNRSSQHERRRNRYAIDIELIQWAYSYLPALDSAEDQQERQEWIALWKEILECLLRTLRPTSEVDRDKEVDGTPYEVDRWILRSISILVLQMDEAERPEQLWQSVLDLGWQAHHWVENFLSGFFSYNLHRTTDATFRNAFVLVWSSMIDYAGASPVWNHSTGSGSWHVGDNWESLMGLSWSFTYPWDSISQPVLPEMQGKFERFCTQHLDGDRMVRKTLRLLCSSAAQQIRLPALLWMEPHFRPDRPDKRSEADEQLGLFLAECWQGHQEELRRSPEVFDCFMRLVKFLADHQSPMALEIQNRVIAG